MRKKHKVSLKNIFIEVVLVSNNNTQQVQNIKNVNNTNKKNKNSLHSVINCTNRQVSVCQ